MTCDHSLLQCAERGRNQPRQRYARFALGGLGGKSRRMPVQHTTVQWHSECFTPERSTHFATVLPSLFTLNINIAHRADRRELRCRFSNAPSAKNPRHLGSSHTGRLHAVLSCMTTDESICAAALPPPPATAARGSHHAHHPIPEQLRCVSYPPARTSLWINTHHGARLDARQRHHTHHEIPSSEFALSLDIAHERAIITILV
jgi:hypothetical protein